jgi:hypothetical protein
MAHRVRWLIPVVGIVVVALLIPIAPEVHAQPLRCDECRQPLVGPYTVYEHKNLHDSCFQRRYAKHCHLCGGMISGQYICNSWGDTVHAVHVGEYPICEFCGRLAAEKLTGKGVRYRDGREICGLCYASAVKDAEHAGAILDTVAAILSGYGIEIDLEFKLKLIDKLEMARITPAVGREAWGSTDLKQRRTLLGLVESRKIKVYALTGMPRVILMGVLAHELMHVWLFTHAPLEMDHVLVEGSCQYATLLVLRDNSDRLAQHYLDTQIGAEDLVYGGGLRSVSRYVQGVGIAAWLSYLRQHEEPPWH